MTPTGIKRLRKKLGLTQAEFAEKLGTGRVQVTRWENGTHKPSRIWQKQIEAFKLTTTREE